MLLHAYPPKSSVGHTYRARSSRHIDSDIAAFYGVQVKVLNQAVKRNAERFPADFSFQLTTEETLTMRSQIVTASRRNVGAPPWAFTKHGVAMLAGILRSDRAVAISIAIIQA